MKETITLKTTYVVDFDGTITSRDITSELAAHYGGNAYIEIENSYRRREIPIQIWLQRIVKVFSVDLELLLEKALEWAEIRPGFDKFLESACESGRAVIIASDGLGFYIEPILEKYGLKKQISFIYHNETYINKSGKLEVRNPHAHRICTVCGNCKAAHVVKLKEEGRSVIYIGDGSNDRFGASWSDHICARDELAESCREHSLIYSQWTDFYDIIKVESPELSDRTNSSLCCPLGRGVKT